MANEDGPYTGLARILGGGTAIVSAVLTFIGIKDAALDRILREEPKAVLLFGGMVALGIVFGLVAQFMRPPGSMRVIWIALWVGALIASFPIVADHSRNEKIEGGWNLILILLAVLVATLLVILMLGPFRLAMTGCLLILGAVLFALGTYGGIRLAIDSRGTTASPEISGPSIVRGEDGLLRLKATVKAEALHACHVLTVTANGRELATTAGGPDGVAALTIDMLVTGNMVDSGMGVLPLSATINSLPHSACAKRDIRELAAAAKAEDDADDDADDQDDANDKDDANDGAQDIAEVAQDIAKALGAAGYRPNGAADSANLRGTLPMAEVNLPVFGLSKAPIITATWSDASTLSVALASTDEMGPTLAAIAAMGRTDTMCEVLSYAVVPIREAGDLAASIPVLIPAGVTDVEVRAMFLSSPPEAIPGRADCGSVSGSDKLTSVVVLRRTPLPRLG